MKNMQDRIDKYVGERSFYGESELRKKLKGRITTNMRTMMIGIIAQIEKFFGNDWGHGLTNNEKNDIQLDKSAIWSQLRESILDFGNSKIRDVEFELNKYTITENKCK